MKTSALKKLDRENEIRQVIEKETEGTGGIFRLAPTWVGRPGIIQPGYRLKLADIYMSREVAVNERWLASVTYADNGAYNNVCPKDHGLSYIVVGGYKILLKDAFDCAPDILLGNRKWDVLPKFFDNWHRIPFHIHPCQEHVRKGLIGKPESYHFPVELNINRNAYPITAVGVDCTYTDDQILSYLNAYFKGDNHLTDLANSINLVPGTGWYMPPCTMHAPGSLVTYELQVASDVTCIPESRVNDMVMPPDLIDRDLPVTVKDNGFETVCKYILSMIRCKDSGNAENFRKEYFRPPVRVRDEGVGHQSFVIYRCGKASERINADRYSAKRTMINPSCTWELQEGAAFGAIVLGGHGRIRIPGKEWVQVESASMFMTREDLGGDEFFVAACAANKVEVECLSMEPLVIYQHFASHSNPEATNLNVPEFEVF